MVNYLKLLQLKLGSQEEVASSLSNGSCLHFSQDSVCQSLENPKNDLFEMHNAAAKLIIAELPKPKLIINEEDEKFPLYHKYSGEFNPQPAYIELNLKNKTVYATYSSEIGNGVSSDVFNAIVLRFKTSCYLPHEKISDLINDNMHVFQFLMATHNVDYDNCNLKSFVNSDLDEEAINLLYNEWYETLFIELDDYETPTICDSLDEWLGDNPVHFTISQHGSFFDFCSDLLSLNGEGQQYMPLSITDVKSLQNAYLDVLAENLYNGCSLGADQAKLLIDDGRCSDSQWMEELTSFVNA